MAKHKSGELRCPATALILNIQSGHYENLPMQYTDIFKVVKNENFQYNFLYILIFAHNVDYRYTLVLPRRGCSNEYPQSMFWSKNKNQRTNGPVNAHLRSAAYTNKHV